MLPVTTADTQLEEFYNSMTCVAEVGRLVVFAKKE
jgi:hypothetical protein